MRDVFISYRRSDTGGYAGRLLDALEERFDGLKFFRDIEDLEPGADFPQAIEGKLSQCEAMLVVIGPTWASVAGPTGPRIKEADDFVRIEVAAALARSDVRVIPVLVGGATLPRAQDLPAELRGLTMRQHVELSDTRWDFDVERLGKALDPSRRTAWLSGKAPIALAAAALVAAVAGGGYWFLGSAPSAPRGPQRADLDSAPDRRLAEAEQELKLAEVEAKKAKAAAERAEFEARKRRADADARQADEAKAQAIAADTKKAAELAMAKSSSADVSDADRSRAEAEATALAKRSEAAQREADVKAAETLAARRTADEARADAQLKSRQAAAAASTVARVAARGATASSPTSLVLPWTLSSGGCGAGELTVRGTATFRIETTSRGVVVTEEFRGTGNGFAVKVTGRATFDRPRQRYDVPTSGEWRGAKVFKSSGTDQVLSSDGKSPRSARLVTIRSNCG